MLFPNSPRETKSQRHDDASSGETADVLDAATGEWVVTLRGTSSALGLTLERQRAKRGVTADSSCPVLPTGELASYPLGSAVEQVGQGAVSPASGVTERNGTSKRSGSGRCLRASIVPMVCIRFACSHDIASLASRVPQGHIC